VLDVARDAFVQGMQVAATISAIIAMTVAILAVVLLREVRSGSAGSSDGEAAEGSDDQEWSRPTAIGAAAVPDC
jgi:hypothetical protein